MKINLQNVRAAVGHSQYSWHQLCKKAGFNRSTYRYWNGEREFPLEVLIKIAYYTNKPLAEFIDRDTLWLLKMVTRENSSFGNI